MKLGRKVGNRSLIRSEKLFFFLEITMIWEKTSKKYRDHHDFGKKKGKYEIKAIFFLREHQVLEILASGP